MAELNIFETFVKSFSCDKISDQDVEDFGQRVFSYIEGQKWISRPLVLSPSICARYGWKCVNSNLLECVACGAKLCTQEPKLDVYEVYKSCLDKIVADLKDGHKIHCPWPLAPSPESFVKMVPLPKEEALSQFESRLKPCLDLKNSIPQIKDSVISELGLKQDDVLSLCKLIGIPSAVTNSVCMSAVCLATTGWTLLSKNNGELKTYVKCDSCQRSIWAKSFNLVDVSSNEIINADNGTNCGIESSSIEKEAKCEKEYSKAENAINGEKDSSNKSVENASNERPHKRFKLDKSDFNPLEEHRPWCRWISVTDARNSSSCKDDKNQIDALVPGWKFYMKFLIRNIPSSQDNSSENTPSKEHIRSVRSLLESWTSPT